jgi:hypothetical protein
MSEQLHVCQALASMVRQHGDPSEEEVRFVGHAAFELGLTAEENEQVQKVLKGGGDYNASLKEITSKPMRMFLFRRVVAAALIDEQINDEERAFIKNTAEAFSYDGGVVDEFVEWMKEGIAWEKRGAELMARI